MDRNKIMAVAGRIAVAVFAFVLLTGTGKRCSAQSEWVAVELQRPVSIAKTEKEVREELLKEARIKAIETYTGVEVTGGDFLLKVSDQVGDQEYFFESFRTFSNQVVNGKIVGEDAPVYIREGDVLYIRYRGLVAKEKYETDPNFNLECSADRKVYQFDDEINFAVKSSKDAYLTIFSVKGDSLSVIFPNMYWKDGNRIKSFVTRQVPNAEEARIGRMYAVPEPGHSEYSELIVFVATLDSVGFELPRENIHIYNNSWMDMNQWLLGIPRNRRAVCYWQMQVVSRP